MQIILVRKRGTNLFLIGEYDWTCDEETARHFHTEEGALAYCARHEIRDAEIVKRDASSVYEIVNAPPRQHDLQPAA